MTLEALYFRIQCRMLHSAHVIISIEDVREVLSIMHNWNAAQIRSLEYALRNALCNTVPGASGLEITDIVVAGVNRWRASYVFELEGGEDGAGDSYFTLTFHSNGISNFMLIS